MVRETPVERTSSLLPGGGLGFGRQFSPTMALARWTDATSWSETTLEKRAPLALDPAAMVLHYGQAIFEGLKALRHPDAIRIFRPDTHARRFQRSSERMCMPELPVETFVRAVRTLVARDHDSVPTPPGCLYLRPTMIATEAALGVRAATEYLFFVIASPSGPYFKDPNKVLRIWVERHYVRAARGGLGSAKAAANYAGSLLASKKAKERGCDQVLWLDSEQHREVEELGSGNVFFVKDGVLVTPPLHDSVLEGVTRDSILTVAKETGLPHEVRSVLLDEALDDVRAGRITEMFTCGTAAVITPVGTLVDETGELTVGHGQVGTLTASLRARLHAILFGEVPDPHGWLLQAWPS